MSKLKKAEEKKGTAIPLRKHPTDETLTTKTIMGIVFRTSLPPEGISLGEMARRMSVIKKFDEVHEKSTVIELDDADLKEIVAAFKKSKWHGHDSFVIEVANDFGYQPE